MQAGDGTTRGTTIGIGDRLGAGEDITAVASAITAAGLTISATTTTTMQCAAEQTVLVPADDMQAIVSVRRRLALLALQ